MRFWCNLPPFWEDFRPPGGVLGALGGLLARLGGLLGHLGGILGHLGAILAYLGGILGHLGGVLGLKNPRQAGAVAEAQGPLLGRIPEGLES